MSFESTKLRYMRKVRERELNAALPHIPPGSRILEIGAGAGWQAQRLDQLGFAVTAIDIEAPTMPSGKGEGVWTTEKVWPIQAYDGVTLPFENESFDVVFSSNVLEHIPHIKAFQAEMQRVLIPGGRGVHLIPSSTWRFAATLLHIPKTALEHIDGRKSKKFPTKLQSDRLQPDTNEMRQERARKGPIGSLGRLVPPAHGARGNFMSELTLFSRYSWVRLFVSAGWEDVLVIPTRIFYSPFLNMLGVPGVRGSRIASRLFGSSCLIYLLNKPTE
jgi:SAM-dependent methyltransferase